MKTTLQSIALAALLLTSCKKDVTNNEYTSLINTEIEKREHNLFHTYEPISTKVDTGINLNQLSESTKDAARKEYQLLYELNPDTDSNTVFDSYKIDFKGSRVTHEYYINNINGQKVKKTAIMLVKEDNTIFSYANL